MPERVVVSFRGEVPHKTAGGGPSYLERALALKKQAEALGATLCAWSAQTFSFDFAPDEIEEAIALASLAADERGGPPGERFGAGVSQGMLDTVGEGGSLAVLSWGRPLLAAVSLARVARPGEVLLDPDLPALRSGELLTVGSRLTVDRAARVRGATLDVAEPWRRQAAASLARLREPPLVGRDAVLEELVVPLGCLAVLRADAGVGGTRLLHEITSRLAPSRALFVAPVRASREPLGAIRRALARSAARDGGAATPEHLRGALDRLLAGDGTDLWSAAELVDAWLGPVDGRHGVLAIDDAADVDASSLEAIANAINVRGGFRMIARIPVEAPVPPAFSSIPTAQAITVGPLAPRDATHLCASFADAAISDEAVARWSRRGGGSPLGLREALAEGLTSGELTFRSATAGSGAEPSKGIAVPRRRSAGKGKPAPPAHWIERRMRFVTGAERAVLTAIAILGGDASAATIDAIATSMAGPGARVAVVEESLLTGGWVKRPEPGWLALRTRTATEAILALLDAGERVRWSLAAAETTEQQGGALGRGDAAWYASQAGDPSRAVRLALDAAHAATRASLDLAAASLRAFALSVRAAARAGAPEPAPIAVDVEVDVSELEGDAPSTSRPSRTSIASIPPGEAGDEPRARFDTLLDESMMAALEGKPSRAPPPRPPRAGDEPPDSNLLTTESPAMGPARLAELAKDALVQGDVTALEGLIAQLRATGEYPELVERMSGFVALGRGAKSEALGKLRMAAAAADQSPAQRARALLAYGVALAAAGRTESALLEALDALARAREASDRHGEHVCARFLARLCSAAGHTGAASAWAQAAKTTTPRG